MFEAAVPAPRKESYRRNALRIDNNEWVQTITYGADFAIGVTPRVAIVPQVRFDSFEFGGPPRFRPEVGVRFGF
jgi:hypothetical protein